MPLNLKSVAKFAARPPREAVDVATNMLSLDDREVMVRLTNISARGFTALSETALTPATWLDIGVPGFGIKRPEVCWLSAGDFGGRFDPCLPTPVVDRL